MAWGKVLNKLNIRLKVLPYKEAAVFLLDIIYGERFPVQTLDEAVCISRNTNNPAMGKL